MATDLDHYKGCSRMQDMKMPELIVLEFYGLENAGLEIDEPSREISQGI